MPFSISRKEKKMRKKLAIMSVCAAALAFTGCASSSSNNESTANTTKSTEATTKDAATEATTTAEAETDAETEAPTDDVTTEAEPETKGSDAEGVMSYAEYMAAAVDDPVKIDCFVQAHQSWWDNKITVYAIDGDIDGGYFIYNMECSEEDAEKLEPGTEIIVSGFKGEWSGEVEIVDATFEIVDGASFIANPIDVTEYLGTDTLKDYMNSFVAFKNLEVVPVGKNDAGEDAAFFYKWDNSGSQGDDLYFKVSDGENEYTFTVESYLTGKDTDVYKAVENLSVGEAVDLEGFLYWYEGPNPHITKCVAAGSEEINDSEYMSHSDFEEADLDTEVKLSVYVQATQSWWDGKISVYAAAHDGAYFIYNMACSEEDAKELTKGKNIIVTGYKGEWSGEMEVIDATFEFGDDSSLISNPVDITEFLGTDDLVSYMNEYVSFKGLEVVPVGKNDAGEDAAWFYKWDNSGSEGDDLYFKVSDGKNEYTFTVESYLCGPDTDVYKAVKELKVGDHISVECFLYWYEGPNPHVTSVDLEK